MQQIPPTVVQQAAEFRVQPPAHGNLAKPRVNRETTTTQMKSDFRYKGQAWSMEGLCKLEILRNVCQSQS